MQSMNTTRNSVLLAVILFSGCAGYDRLLFVTKTNVGVDIDTTPPTAEVTIARREVAIAPSYDRGQTPPILATFQRTGSLFATELKAVFAGGDAAVVMGTLYDQETPPLEAWKPSAHSSHLCLRERPQKTLPFPLGLFTPKDALREGETRPFYFGTDTTYGLKVAWSGTTSAVPDSLKLGYNRKEFALAPLAGEKRECALVGDDLKQEFGSYVVTVPAFVATIENGSEIKSITDSKITYGQVFATGAAATALARQRDIRRPMVTTVEAAAGVTTTTTTTTTLP